MILLPAVFDFRRENFCVDSIIRARKAASGIYEVNPIRRIDRWDVRKGRQNWRPKYHARAPRICSVAILQVLSSASLVREPICGVRWKLSSVISGSSAFGGSVVNTSK